MSKSLKTLLICFILCIVTVAGGCNFSIVFETDETTTETVPQEYTSYETAPSGNTQEFPVINTTQADIVQTTAVPETSYTDMQQPSSAPIAPADAALAGNPASMTTSEQLAYFNAAVNRIKTARIGFTKTKKTETKDIRLSNPIANSLVSIVKDTLISDETESLTVTAGEVSDPVVSPSNMPFVSALGIDDVEDISVQSDSSGYIITVRVRSETNPAAKGSICSRIFDFITLDEVESEYAPKVGAEVSRDNMSMVYSGCYARAKVDFSGNVLEYETYVQGTMTMKGAKIRVINTDVSAVIASTVRYTDMKYSTDVEF